MRWGSRSGAEAGDECPIRLFLDPYAASSSERPDTEGSKTIGGAGMNPRNRKLENFNVDALVNGGWKRVVRDR